jgi:hypothetical protein
MLQLQRIEAFQSRMFEIQKIQNCWDKREKWYKKIQKRIIFVKNVTKTKNLIISSFLIKNDLFNETSVLINYVLKNKILTITMINIDVSEYVFVDKSIAQSFCQVLKIEFVQLIKKRLIRFMMIEKIKLSFTLFIQKWSFKDILKISFLCWLSSWDNKF